MNTVTIDPQEVEFWLAYTEGWYKAAGFIVTFAGLIYHYIGVGPNKETDDDEEENDHE